MSLVLCKVVCGVCFTSYKFGKKLTYVNRLDDLQEALYLDQVDIPQEVKEYVNPYSMIFNVILASVMMLS